MCNWSDMPEEPMPLETQRHKLGISKSATDHAYRGRIAGGA